MARPRRLAAPVTKATFPFRWRALKSVAGIVYQKSSTLDQTKRQAIPATSANLLQEFLDGWGWQIVTC